VPVNIDTAAGLEAAEIRLAYDTQALQLLTISKGTVTKGFETFVAGAADGIVKIDASNSRPLEGGHREPG